MIKDIIFNKKVNSRQSDSNGRPTLYERVALPLSYAGKPSLTRQKRDTRIELASLAWEANVLPLY